jgi:hypothetical protein
MATLVQFGVSYIVTLNTIRNNDTVRTNYLVTGKFRDIEKRKTEN